MRRPDGWRAWLWGSRYELLPIEYMGRLAVRERLGTGYGETLAADFPPERVKPRIGNLGLRLWPLIDLSVKLVWL